MQLDTPRAPGRKLDFLELCGVVAVCLVAACAAFELMLHLRDILEPLIFSGFLVAAIEKPVESVYTFLTVHLCTCCRRRRTKFDGTDNVGSPQAAEPRAVEEARPLVPERQGRKDRAISVEMMVEEAVQCDGLIRIISVMVVLFAISCVLFGLGVMVFYSGMHMKEEWPAYKSGALRVGKTLEAAIDGVLHSLKLPQGDIDKYIKSSYQGVLEGAEKLLWNLLNRLIADVSGALSWVLLTFLYVFFWLLRPLPLTDKMNECIRSYILKKTIICAGYGICVALLFYALRIDLAAVFGFISFILNYLPEVGPFLSMIIPAPVILLDGRLENPFATFFAALLGQLLLKFFFGNYLEVKIIESDEMMNLHPIWILLGLTYFGFVWGPIGMLLSVPILAMLKVAALPETGLMPKSYGLSMLACLEGRKYRKGEIQ